MKSSLWAGLLVAMGVFSVLNVSSVEAADEFGPTVVPTAKQLLRLVYEDMPIPPKRLPSTGATTDDWCRFSMKLESEAVKGGADETCKLMGELLVECSDSTMGYAIKHLSKPGARLPRFGIGPCVEAKKHVGECVLELSQTHPSDISAEGKPDCSAWVATTSCTGNMQAGYDQAKGDKADSCGDQKAGFAKRRSANSNGTGSCRIYVNTSVMQSSGEQCYIALSTSYECDTEKLKHAAYLLFGLLPSLGVEQPCSDAIRAGTKLSCITTVSNIALNDFGPFDVPKVCGDWKMNTKCSDEGLLVFDYSRIIPHLSCASKRHSNGDVALH